MLFQDLALAQAAFSKNLSPSFCYLSFEKMDLVWSEGTCSSGSWALHGLCCNRIDFLWEFKFNSFQTNTDALCGVISLGEARAAGTDCSGAQRFPETASSSISLPAPHPSCTQHAAGGGPAWGADSTGDEIFNATTKKMISSIPRFASISLPEPPVPP